MSLNDIWSEPISEPAKPVSHPQGTSSKRSRPSLFLSDSEDEHVGDGPRHAGPRLASPSKDADSPSNVDTAKLDAMFAGVDDDDDPFTSEPILDLEKMRRQANARLAANGAPKSTIPSTTPYAIGGESSPAQDKEKDDKGKKAKRAIPKLDEERLLGRDGFPRLIKEYKNFKVTGKGHEAADLEKLFRIYHGWTHKMYPKFQFRDTVDRVEKLCRSRRMTVNLKVWRDEAHGIKPGVQHEVTQDDDEDKPDEQDDEEAEGDQAPPAEEALSPTSSRPNTPITRPSSAASTVPSVPSSATDANDDFDMDVDALLREEEELMRETQSTGYKPSNMEDDEDALWAAAGAIPGDNLEVEKTQPTSAASAHGEADDEEMWDMMDQMDAQTSTAPKTTDVGDSASGDADKPAAPPTTFGEPSIGADWDDMYVT